MLFKLSTNIVYNVCFRTRRAVQRNQVTATRRWTVVNHLDVNVHVIVYETRRIIIGNIKRRLMLLVMDWEYVQTVFNYLFIIFNVLDNHRSASVQSTQCTTPGNSRQNRDVTNNNYNCNHNDWQNTGNKRRYTDNHQPDFGHVTSPYEQRKRKSRHMMQNKIHVQSSNPKLNNNYETM